MTPSDPNDPTAGYADDPAATPALEPLRAFTSIADRYEVDRVLGPCARGFLYTARDRVEGRTVTLEVLPNALASDAAGVAAFVGEAMAAAALPSTSPASAGIARPLAAGADAQLGVLWLAFEPFEGEGLRARIARGGLSPRESVAIVTRVLDALAGAHAAGKAHRGLEPDDIVLVRNPDGSEGVRLLDFGFPRALAAAADSPYVSPEQARSSGWVTPAADTYSVGAIFYEMIAGHAPAYPPRPSLADVAPQTPGGIVQLVERALSTDPGLRPTSAAAMRDEIQRLLAPPRPAPVAPSAAGYGAPSPYGAPVPYGAPSPYGAPVAAAAPIGQPVYGPRPPLGGPTSAAPAQGGRSVWPWVVGLLGLVGFCLLTPVVLIVVFAVIGAREAANRPPYEPYDPIEEPVAADDYVDEDYDDDAPVAQVAAGIERYQVSVDADDPQRGSREALVTIVAFSDFQCPFCSRATATLTELEASYGADLRIVWRDQPLAFHQNAQPAALLAREAYAQQGDAGFWRMHDTLFANQRQLERDDLLRYAREQALDVSRVRRALDSRAALPKIEASSALGNRIGASGTPTFFINGRKLTGAQPAAAFRTMIDEELRTARARVLAGSARANVYADITAGGLTAEAAEPARADPIAGPEPDADQVHTLSLRSGAPSKGPAGAPVTIELFSDFQCPFCSRLAPTLETLMANNPGKIRLVWRNYPLPFHNDAQLAAEAALEAQAQGGDRKFWQMHDLLFANQRALGRSDLERYASQIGLDVGRFRSALDSHVHASAIQADKDAVTATGLSIGTPTCFVNGRKVQGAQPLSAFQTAVDRALAER